jgi:hypothetical protein
MSENLSRRSFVNLTAGLALSAVPVLASAKQGTGQAVAPAQSAGPVEAPFNRDYEAPGFTPKWKKPQLNRLMVQDFVIFCHMDLEKVKMMLEKEPRLVAAHMDWGGGDWESGLGGASHMANKEIVNYLLEKGARIDIFCAAMMGQLDVVKSFLTLQPNLIDSYGPHGMTLHFHAQRGKATEVYDYLQSIKKIG